MRNVLRVQSLKRNAVVVAGKTVVAYLHNIYATTTARKLSTMRSSATGFWEPWNRVGSGLGGKIGRGVGDKLGLFPSPDISIIGINL